MAESVELLIGGDGQTARVGHGDEVIDAGTPSYLASMDPAYKVFFEPTSRFY
jgi:hypothetical protein